MAHSDLIRGQSGAGPRGEALDGYAVKHRLVEAALAAIDAISEVDRGARFLHVEPVIHVAAPHDRPDLRQAADTFSGYQWQAWDMLLGRAAPELGGSPRAIDLIGVNHYHDAQWEFGGGALDWLRNDPRRRTFSNLLGEVWQRYRLPIVVAETSHVGYHRAPWLDHIADETRRAIEAGVPVQGLCLYPVIDRPNWNDLDHWHHSGLWDIVDAAAVAATRRRRSHPAAGRATAACRGISMRPMRARSPDGSAAWRRCSMRSAEATKLRHRHRPRLCRRTAVPAGPCRTSCRPRVADTAGACRPLRSQARCAARGATSTAPSGCAGIWCSSAGAAGRG